MTAASDLDAALTELSTADRRGTTVHRGNPRQDRRTTPAPEQCHPNPGRPPHGLENILHVAPTAFSNGYNIYNPNIPGAVGTFIINNFSNPVKFICSRDRRRRERHRRRNRQIVLANISARDCDAELQLPAHPVNPVLQPSATPDKIIYADPGWLPAAAGLPPGPPETPPAVSAYTGLAGREPKNLPELLLPAPTRPALAGRPAPPTRPATNADTTDHATDLTDRLATRRSAVCS